MYETEVVAKVDGVSPFKAINFRKRGQRKGVIPPGDVRIGEHTKTPEMNSPLINAIARAFYWAKLIDLGLVASGSEIAEKEGLEASTVNERLRLSLLSPSIIESILSGTQSENLTMQWLTTNSLPANWCKQNKLFQNIEIAFE